MPITKTTRDARRASQLVPSTSSVESDALYKEYEAAIAQQQRMLDATIARKHTRAACALAHSDTITSFGLLIKAVFGAEGLPEREVDRANDLAANVEEYAKAVLADTGAKNVITDHEIDIAQRQIDAMHAALAGARKRNAGVR